MEKSFPFNAVLTDGVPDRVYTAEDFAAERAAYVSNGVTSADGLCVSASASGGMSVDVSAGAAVIDGYTYFNTAPLTLAVPAADGALARVDLVVLRLDLSARRMYCALKAGTPSATALAPDCTVSESIREIPLAAVTVAAGESVIEQAAVADMRVRADYILNRLEVAALLEKYERALADYFGEADAARLVAASKIVRTDAGADKALFGDGVYRGVGKLVELARFTKSGTFTPAEYPSACGLYTVILQGGGGAGARSSTISPPGGGAAGGFCVVSNLPLRQDKTYEVTVGAGGEMAAMVNGGTFRGAVGGATSFAGHTVPGGEGGGTENTEIVPVTVGIFTAELGTIGNGGGAASFFGDGSINVTSAAEEALRTDAAYGAGGGGCSYIGGTTGAGGDGIVIIYGYAP